MMLALFASALFQLQAPLPGALEVRPGLFVVKGAMPTATLEALRAAGITHVLNLRHEAEGDFRKDAGLAKQAGADYQICPLDREPSDTALDAFRTRMKALPKGSRALVHCASGNRVAGALFAHWTLDAGMEDAAALELARKAGLSNPVTEAAARAYVAKRRSR